MTYDEAAACYPDGAKVRWVACHAALGRRPRAYEFIVWISAQWGRFAEAHRIAPGSWAAGAVRDVLGPSADAQFDAWLVEQAQEGQRHV